MFSFEKIKWNFINVSLIFITTFLGIQHTAGEELMITKFTVPPHVNKDNDVVLECEHTLPEESLISVKWSFNDTEFYRYSMDNKRRNDLPKMKFNNSAGIVVDMKQSSQKKVVLLNMKLTASGVYECEVLGDKPDYLDAKKRGNMTVVVIPKARPKIEPTPSEGLRPGSHVDLNCTAEPSIPKATLEWHVNDKPAPETSLKHYEAEVLKNGLIVSRLGLHFKLQRNHYKNGELKLKCTAKIATLYTKYQEHNHSKPKGSTLKVDPDNTAGGCVCPRTSLWLFVPTTLLSLLRR